MEEEDLANEKDITIKLEDSVEILTTDDVRLGIIGEELSNEMGRAILIKLFEGVDSVSEIASSLNASIPLVRWHIQRLLKVNLISTDHFDISEKNRKVQRYRPAKFALVIIPSNVVKSEIYSNILKSAVKKIYKTISALVVFVASTIVIYQLTNRGTVNTTSNTNQFLNGTSFIITKLSNATTTQISQLPNTNQLFNQDFVFSLIMGSVIGISTWICLRLLSKKKKID
ncbi:MAG: winged helix-turn-helix transcriptional regulator [Thaumarchaeota archaeon]|nr:winged helix-turn-helix transcriptional regulator [Nitrososphaerota archaeon]